ncbi:type I methionyl aminopeptidase [Candidatus Poribacteria bacterium]|nr:MAG: type I methionyl aminopeptidase [Candidatus Poribacteria bacterium]
MDKLRIKNKVEIEKMKRSGKAAATVLKRIGEAIAPGVSTADLERISRDTIAEVNATSSFLGYQLPEHEPYPATICTSINDVIIHGIPDKSQVVKEGDIIGIDTAVSIEGYHGDNAYTFPVGNISPLAERLLEATRNSLYDAIAEAKSGNRIGDISSKLQNGAESEGFSVLQSFAGHGIGRNLHEAPEVPCIGVAGRGLRLRPGMVLAIETMVNVGLPDVQMLADGWTITTADGSLSALFEHTVAILSDGPEILTGSSLWEI